jgi:SagB-type dehydrogenase family enzyme
MVRKNDLDYLVVAALLATGLYTLASGLIADSFGFPRFLYHDIGGYACALLGAAHLALNWSRVKAYLRRRLRRRRPASGRRLEGREGMPRSPGETPDSIVTRSGRPSRGRARTRVLDRRMVLASVLSAAGGLALGRIVPRRRMVDLALDNGDLGLAYHEWSAPGRNRAGVGSVDWGGRPDGQKAYPGSETILLPDPRGWSGPAIEAVIEARRSRRAYGPGALRLEDLSRLLHAASGITDQARGFRSAPSAGALYPIELYAVVHDVASLREGVYHYSPAGHALEMVRVGDLRSGILVAGIGQEMLARAQVCLVLTAIFQRTRWRYRERAYRYILLEAGHIAQNVYLTATGLGLGSCAVGAFLDDELNRLVGVDGSDEAALYLLTVGTS